MKAFRALFFGVIGLAIVAISGCGKDEDAPNCTGEFTNEIQKLEAGIRNASALGTLQSYTSRINQFEEKWAAESCVTGKSSDQKTKLTGQAEADRLRSFLKSKIEAVTPVVAPAPSPSASPSGTPAPGPSSSPSPGTPSPKPSQTTPPTVPSQPSQLVVEFFSASDNCTGTSSGNITLLPGSDSHTQCKAQLGTTGKRWAWSIRVNGVCQDIVDTFVMDACSALNAPGQTASTATQVQFFEYSDFCSGEVLYSKTFNASQPAHEQCDDISWRKGRKSVWSMKVNGICQNIVDTSLKFACNGFEIPKFYNPDHSEFTTFAGADCNHKIGRSGILVPDQDLMTQCHSSKKISSTRTASSVRVNGACIALGFSDPISACLKSAPTSKAGASVILVFPETNNCSGDISYGAYLAPGPGRAAACLAMMPNKMASGRKGVSSIEIDGVCKDVPDTKFKEFCDSI
ncbi:MAG: hypothetical protein JNL01_05630 [Bdellovibrionales bacterium]|nr:hypothetical protein [Bdellovibrionales bacterium]